MRLLIPALCLTAVGCGSSWSGPPFPTLAEAPHWLDCDCDGWGDPAMPEQECKPLDNVPVAPLCGAVADGEPCCPTTCPGGGAPQWVENDLDCDDLYAASGPDLTGMGCMSGYDWLYGDPTDTRAYVYAVFDDAVREFAVYDQPMTMYEAASICRDWARGVDVSTQPEDAALDPGGVATLSNAAERATVLNGLRDAALTLRPGGPDRVVAWVDMRFLSLSTPPWEWDIGSESVWEHDNWDETALVWDDVGGTEVQLPYCPGVEPFTLDDLLTFPLGYDVGFEDDLDPAHPVHQFWANMLIPVEFPLGEGAPCIRRPNSGCEEVNAPGQLTPPETGVCPTFAALCERPAVPPIELTLYRFAEGFCPSADSALTD